MEDTIPTIEEIIQLSGVHKLKIRNIYVYGSRVYGTNKPDSDYDIVLTAGALLNHEEIKNEKLNIHIHTPDKFRNDLKNYLIYALECFYAPAWARLQEKDIFADFTIDKNKLKQSILTQSSNTWIGAKYKFTNGDIVRGLKSGFHAIKCLNYGIQIIQKDKIENFGQNNDLMREIMESDFYDWKPFKEKYLSKKIELEEALKNA